MRPEGLEPSTPRLRAECSAIELRTLAENKFEPAPNGIGIFSYTPCGLAPLAANGQLSYLESSFQEYCDP